MLIRGERRGADVLVTVDGDPLDWRASLALPNHSPTGPAWGYGGSGPAQLALAILLALTDPETAEVDAGTVTSNCCVAEKPSGPRAVTHALGHRRDRGGGTRHADRGHPGRRRGCLARGRVPKRAGDRKPPRRSPPRRALDGAVHAVFVMERDGDVDPVDVQVLEMLDVVERNERLGPIRGPGGD